MESIFNYFQILVKTILIKWSPIIGPFIKMHCTYFFIVKNKGRIFTIGIILLNFTYLSAQH